MPFSADDPNARTPRLGLPDLGVGIGLRVPHYAAVLEKQAPATWFEIISENFMVEGGRPRENLDRALDRYRLVQHGVSLGIGNTDPLDFDYLAKLKKLVRLTRTPWLSDHLCWTGSGGVHLHDLLPLPYTEAVMKHVAERARIVQDYLEVPFALENASSYLTYTSSTMTEWDFLTGILEGANIGVLLDVNNIFVSSENHGFDPNAYVDAIPAHRVIQIHLAGHTRFPTHILDTHTGVVSDPVWELYRRALRRTGPVSTLVEWDDEIPPFEDVWAEAEKAEAVRRELFGVPKSAVSETPLEVVSP
jgi:uncharacterized protein (UPF0276 family)